MAKEYVLAIDQGTTSTRAMLFNHDGTVAGVAQQEHEQIYPRAGWVEHDPKEIWEKAQAVTAQVLRDKGITNDNIAAVGITNQRETTVVWDRNTGEPVYNAIVWQDTRTQPIVSQWKQEGYEEEIKPKTGLVIATYFSGTKIAWILENVEGARQRAEAGDLVFGNTDTWLIWNLTGGVDGGRHITDYTNASRTMLFNLANTDWDDHLLQRLNIPKSMLPELRPSSDRDFYGMTRPDGVLGGEVPVCGDAGDQQAALFGQTCFDVGQAKNTYGTGNFLLQNTGNQVVPSKSGLLTTGFYALEPHKSFYALEGSIAITGAAVQWLRDNLKMIASADETEEIARSVEDSGGAYFVPAFSALLGREGPRRHRRADPLRQPRPPGPRHAGVDVLPEPRRGRGGGAGLRQAPAGPAGGRRRGQERLPDATAGRHPRHPGDPAPGAGDHRAGGRLPCRDRHRLLVEPRRDARELAGGQDLRATVVGGPARDRLCAVEEGHRADPGMDRLTCSRPTRRWSGSGAPRR
jgi:glycerol kinase